MATLIVCVSECVTVCESRGGGESDPLLSDFLTLLTAAYCTDATLLLLYDSRPVLRPRVITLLICHEAFNDSLWLRENGLILFFLLKQAGWF